MARMGSCPKLRNSGILSRWVGLHQTRSREISKEAVVVIQVRQRVMVYLVAAGMRGGNRLNILEVE